MLRTLIAEDSVTRCRVPECLLTLTTYNFFMTLRVYRSHVVVVYCHDSTLVCPVKWTTSFSF